MGTVTRLLRFVSYVIAVFTACVALALVALSCSKPAGANSQQPNPSPAVSADIAAKAATPATAAAAGDVPALQSPAVLAVVASALAATSESDVAAIERALATIDADGLLAEAESSLTAALAEAVAAGKPAPGLHLALAFLYGRKGLADKAYAALLAAEAAASAPGISFSLAAIHGRKALLSPSSATGAFSVTVSCDNSGALASLDGGPAHAVPARFEALRPGKHEVAVTRAGYETYIEHVDGKDGGSLNVTAVLVPARVEVEVASDPSGATVSIDRIAVGSTPWRGLVAPGMHKVTITSARYVTQTYDLDIDIGDEPKTVTARLELLPARVTVVSDPAGKYVQIWLDKVHVGTAPLEIDIHEPGEHTVKSTSGPAGYGPSPEVSFEATLGESMSVTVRPSTQFGYLSLGGKDTDGASMFVDGILVGVLPRDKTVLLTLEDHKVELRKPGFKTFIKTVSISQPGVGNSFDVTMVKDDSVSEILMPPYAVPKRTIIVDGAVDDWAGIAPACTDKAGDDRLPLEPGTDISAVYLASDDKYVYARIDLADGNRKSKAREASCYTVRLAGDPASPGFVVTVNLDVYYDVEARVWKTQVWLKNMADRCVDQGNSRNLGVTFQFKIGEGVVEMRVARSTIQKYFKTAGPFLVWGQYHVWEKWDATGDDTERTRFTLGW